MATYDISDMLRQKETPSKKSKKDGAKGSVAMLKESVQLGCVSQDSNPRKFFPQIKKSGKKGSIARDHPQVWPHECSPCASKFGERSHEETLRQERCARKAAWDLAKMFTSSRIQTKLHSILLLKRR